MTNAYRLFHRPGLIADRFGSIAVLYRYEGQCKLSSEALHKVAEQLKDELGLTAVWQKEFFIDRNRNAPKSILLCGENEPTVEATENGLRYLIRPEEGYSPGLFLDQRENRKFLRERSRGKRVCNGFAYTCGFSVAAAAGGAVETVSVDLSKKYLEWGKANFALNSLEGNHRFISKDIFSWAKRAGLFDLVVLDPPSFSRSKETGAFSLKKDIGKLLELGAKLVAPGGEFFFSCNHSEVSSDYLKRRLKEVTEREIEWLDLPLPPKEFPFQTFPLKMFLACLQ